MTLNELVNFLLHWISINTNYETSKFDFPVNIVEPDCNSKNGLWWKMSSCCIFFRKSGIFLSTNGFR